MAIDRSFWRSRVSDVDDYVMNNVKKGTTRSIAASPEGRPIWAVSYGPARPEAAATTFSGGQASGDLSSFFGPSAAEHPPVMVLVGGTHGAEMEGIVGALNLLQVMESGEDFRGKAWPQLKEFLDGARVVVIPSLNPDGRARVDPDSLVGLSYEQFRYWAQGCWKSGELIGYPACKMYQPLPPDGVGFLGGYPNGQGVNLVHDVSLTGPMSPENQAFFRLLERERPDCVVMAHSCENRPFFIYPDRILPDDMLAAHYKLMRSTYASLDQKGLRPAEFMKQPEGGYAKTRFNMSTAVYATCGAWPLVFECTHGIETNPFTHEEILEIQLTLYEEAVQRVCGEGFRAVNSSPFR